MYNFFKSGTLLALLFTFAFQLGVSAQIQDIKKKSSSNNSKSSSSSSSSSSSDSGSDIANECIGGCITDIFSIVFQGCITSIFNGKDDDDNEISNSDFNFEDDYLYREPTDSVLNENKIGPTDSFPSNKISDSNKKIPLKNNKTYAEINYPSEVKSNIDLSFELKPHFDLAFHKGIDKNYTYVDYLPGARVNLNFLLIDFRYNILTEYTNDFPDSFKSWELLFMIDLTAKQDFKVIIGTGIHREIWDDEPISFHEWYVGTKIPFANGADYFDADSRFSVDYDTDAFPFFEIGARYNKRFMNFEHLAAYITLGAGYQNYYQSHDIWSVRGGIVLEIF